MAPSIVQNVTETVSTLSLTPGKGKSLLKEPLKYSGSLDQFPHEDLTPSIGTEFTSATQLSQLLKSDDADKLIKDLAILISQRGVVFFRSQDLDIAAQKVLGQKLGELSGKPSTSGLHTHPTLYTSELGEDISVIDTSQFYYAQKNERSAFASNGWHADITFEKVPSDYAILKIHTKPKTGGDTLWSSAYEAYDRLTPALRGFLETLTATHQGTQFLEISKRLGFPIATNRGAPENTSPEGDDLTAVHPVIRTNPVTGWKGLFVNRAYCLLPWGINGSFTKRINELSKDESDNLLEYLYKHIANNHDFQVRHRWTVNDVAIWDNRSAFHNITLDYKVDEARKGDRVVSLGEKPYLDPNSTSRREALGLLESYFN